VSRRNFIHREGGFSLIELLVSLCILGLLAIASLPTARKDSVKSVSLELSHLLSTSKALAESLGTVAKVIYLEEERRVKAEFQGLKLEKQLLIPERLELTISGGGSLGATQRLIYTGRGTSSPARIVVRSDNQHCTIYQSIKGARRMLCSE